MKKVTEAKKRFSAKSDIPLSSHFVDGAYERMKEREDRFIDALSQAPNEADTRLKVLDRILFEVFQWSYDAVFTEPLTESGYIDYILTIGERRNALVIEAKRAGRLAPASKIATASAVSLSGPVVKPLMDGIKQALSYATEKGVPVAAVTDGHTWLFFRASRVDGRPPLEGTGILFPSIASAFENFAKYAEMLAPQAIVDRLHLAHLNDAEGIKVSDAEQQYFVFDPQSARLRPQDPLAADASQLFSQFFSQISNEQDREMLRDCFVETNESQKAELELQKIIQKVVANISALSTDSGGALQAEIERTLNSKRSETVLLIGCQSASKIAPGSASKIDPGVGWWRGVSP